MLASASKHNLSRNTMVLPQDQPSDSNTHSDLQNSNTTNSKKLNHSNLQLPPLYQKVVNHTMNTSNVLVPQHSSIGTLSQKSNQRSVSPFNGVHIPILNF